MKTTVEIPDVLYRRARKHCVDRNLTFRELIEQGLTLALDPPSPRKRFRLKPFGFRGDGQLLQDWGEIRNAIYEGRGGSPDQS